MRNPDNAMGYNKTIIFAYLMMNRDNLFLKDNLSRISKNAGINAIKNNIKSFEYGGGRKGRRCCYKGNEKTHFSIYKELKRL